MHNSGRKRCNDSPSPSQLHFQIPLSLSLSLSLSLTSLRDGGGDRRWMARTNKYASLNFNDIYEKKQPSSSSSPSSSSTSFTNPNKTIISNSRIHGSMLVLSRPSPKPISQPSPPPTPPPQKPQSTNLDLTRVDPDPISLRPLGRTGATPTIASSPLTSPRSDRFVPPHLRPGFAGREERLQPEFQKQPGPGPVARSREVGNHRQGQFGSPNRYDEEGRPKSGGGYERMRRVGDSDLIELNRPGSSGSRPSSSG